MENSESRPSSGRSDVREAMQKEERCLSSALYGRVWFTSSANPLSFGEEIVLCVGDPI